MDEDLDLIQKELDSDIRDLKKVKGDHTHKLPRAVTEKAKRKSEGGGSKSSTKGSKSGHVISATTSYDPSNLDENKPSFWRRIFSRKGRGK